jgi:two-component system chemotaxis response regulator CheY
MKMDELFRIGLLSTVELLASLEEPAPPDSLQFREDRLPPLESLYDSRLLAKLDPKLALNKKTEAATSLHERIIISEGEIYYPDNCRLSSSSTTAIRYMIVDDTEVMIEMFSEVVEMTGGIVVGTASNGAEALVLYIDVLPDVVVIDISMPDMDGIEAIKRIFAINPEANVIVISGNNYEDVRNTLFALGICVFIGKPFHIQQVVELITRLSSAGA